MMGSHCRLYDENLVRNIMISTGVSIMEYARQSSKLDMQEVCEFVETNADSIIAETIRDLNGAEKEGEEGFPRDDGKP